MRRSQTLSPLRASPLEHQPAVFAGHARSKSVGLRASPVVWLKGPLRHSRNILLLAKMARLMVGSSYVKKASDY